MRTTPFPLSAGLSIAYFYRNCFSILIRLALTNFPIMSYTSWTYKSSPMYQYHSLPQTNSHWTVSTFLQLYFMVNRSRKIAWIRALIHRAHKICSNDDLLQKRHEQHQTIYVMEWLPTQTNQKMYLPIPSFNHY